MPSMTCTIGFGKANTKTQLVTWASFKVTPPFERVTAVSSGQNRGKTSTPVGRYEHTGVLISANVEHEQGTIFLLQAKWMSGAHLQAEGGLFIRLRPRAALINIIAKVPTGPENVCGDSFVMFSGNADILNTSDLEHSGLTIPSSYIKRYMDMEELGECFRIVQVHPETSPRPSLEAIHTPTGVQLREVAAAPPRRLRLRGSSGG